MVYRGRSFKVTGRDYVVGKDSVSTETKPVTHISDTPSLQIIPLPLSVKLLRGGQNRDFGAFSVFKNSHSGNLEIILHQPSVEMVSDLMLKMPIPQFIEKYN
jgi:hypothetical protein